MNYPFLTRELAMRIGRSEADHIGSWGAVLRAEAGNPFGVDIRYFGNAVALSNQAMSLGPLFNRVIGWGEAEIESLDAILQFYGEKGIGCRIDVSPYQATPALLQRLSAAGLHPWRFHDFLYATPAALRAAECPPVAAGIEARRVKQEELPTWATVWREGFTEVLGAAPTVLPLLADVTSRLHDAPGWTLYLALIGGVPAAAGALYIKDGIASVAIAGTRPEFRHRGCQTALLQARLNDACIRGCDLVVAQAALGVTSHHNMERVGLRVAYTRPFWLQPTER